MQSLSLSDIVKKFNTIPFLFVGSGLTRRYYDLPHWKGLLEIFAKKVDNDDFSYAKFENQAKISNPKAGLFPKIAELIENEFNKKWFEKSIERRVNEKYLPDIISGSVSPFKAEVATFLEEKSIPNSHFIPEIEKFKNLSKKSISGIITTNYDCFLEKYMVDYTTYIGQEELIFSPIQGIAEIYKIHGCVSQPQSIVLNEVDYLDFIEKSSYLAAKLMTIFLEYPIIFLGYSLSDPNIQEILSSISHCLSEDNLYKLKDRFIFIQYEPNFNNIEICPYAMNFGSKVIHMTKIKLSNFMLLYDALSQKKARLPVKMFRFFKEEFYNFTITNTPTSKLRVAFIDDDRIENEDLVLAIGKASDLGYKGLKGLTTNEWYRNIITGELNATADELLTYAYPALIKQSNILPLNKYLSESTQSFPEYEQIAAKNDFDTIISNSIKKNRHKKQIPRRNIQAIWDDNNNNFEKKLGLMAYLEENEIDVSILENILKKIFADDNNILENSKQFEKTNLRRMIRVYDYLKYTKNRKNPSK